ncbi:hypothetical protein AQUCO_07200119v1 [Aquilegia coerulea]|uniref:Glutaredoxin domain-containing protein n=1 Tax=Aquilegia coerulea TaxID=218851 RepID=A0A2G5CAE3_AQUCA|nr:hypothetical protein AQUCO_07200119v1 [Aquilegia coerulea]
MGCISSKVFKNDFNQESPLFTNPDCVSLTSSTYGFLKLDQEGGSFLETMTSPPVAHSTLGLDKPEIINTWELMEDLEDGIHIPVVMKKSPKPFNSSKKQKKFGGKENKPKQNGFEGSRRRLDFTPPPPQVLKPLNSAFDVKMNTFGINSRLSESSKQSPWPLFDPELIAFFEEVEFYEEGEQIKNMISFKPKNCNFLDSETILELFEKTCPPGGDNAVIIYTTTLRGIRKTFEECNIVRSLIESHDIQMMERDISMDLGYREDLRLLLRNREFKVPMVFIKGSLIGGVNELAKLEEEGKLGILLEDIPRARVGCEGCEGCVGMRFAMCMECSGSCKVLDEVQNEIVRCGECNENGLIPCPICC